MSFRSIRRLFEPVMPLGHVPLHVCEACHGDYVSPTGWADETERLRRVYLRCGACGHTRDVVVGREVARIFTRAVDKRLEAIARAAEGLERERMAEWVDAFTSALQRDLIDAADF